METWKRTLYILAFVQFVSAVGMSSIFTFLPLYVDELGSHTGMSVEFMAGLVFSVQGFTMMIAAPFWGALADRHGRKPMVLRATLGGAVVILLMAFVRSAEELVALRALQGLITGVFTALTALVAASAPRDRTGYALGLLQVGLWAGISTGPLLGGFVADHAGFQASFFATAALLAVAGALTAWGVHEDFEPLPRAATGDPGFVGAWNHVLAIKAVRTTYLIRFLSRLGRTMIFPFIALFVQELMGEADNVASVTGLVLAISAAGGTVSAVYLGKLGDRAGHRRILMITALLAGVLYIPISLVGSVWQFAVLLTATGVIAGGIMPALSALLAVYTEPGEEGAVYGLESAIISGARALSPMIGAVLVSWFGLRSVYIAVGIIFLMMAVVVQRWLPPTKPEVSSPVSRPVAGPERPAAHQSRLR